jgi:hypothetical protein
LARAFPSFFIFMSAATYSAAVDSPAANLAFASWTEEAIRSISDRTAPPTSRLIAPSSI